MGIALLFLGQFSLYTYLRPFLETVTGVAGIVKIRLRPGVRMIEAPNTSSICRRSMLTLS